MTKKSKTTKKALLLSAGSLMLSCAMLVGTTFAWFTDEVKSTNNKIVAGNLDAEMYFATQLIDADNTKDKNIWNFGSDNGQDVDAQHNVEKLGDGQTIFVTPKDEEAEAGKEHLWEPGHVEVAYLKIRNTGTLAFGYNLRVKTTQETTGTNMAGATFKLSDHLKVRAIQSVNAPADGVTEDERNPAEKALFYKDRAEARTAIEEAKTTTQNSKTGIKVTDGSLDKINIDGYVLPQGADNAVEEEPSYQFVTLLVYMPEKTDNVANYKTGTEAPTIKFDVQLEAHQIPYESDSFGIDYDENATQNDSESLKKAVAEFNTAEDDGTYPTGDFNLDLGADIAEAEGIVTHENQEVTIDFHGHEMEVKTPVGDTSPQHLAVQFQKGSTVTLKDGTLTDADGASELNILIQNYANSLTLKDMTITAVNAQYALSSNNGNVTVTGNTKITASKEGTAVDLMHWPDHSPSYDQPTMTFDDNFVGVVDGKINVHCHDESGVCEKCQNKPKLIIKGGTFLNTGITDIDEFKKFVPGADSTYTVTQINGSKDSYKVTKTEKP